ncbi:MAG: HAD family hydrolase [Myxococcales bacterium]|nr:HAD hydrolase-like protein [Polyangiaceae bacterium]MDW8251686.1 HAD family hydrolase [Myxococcales bacterium]
MSPSLFLFDIDGTLLNTGGAGRRAMASAFGLHYLRPDACEGFSFGGMTDRAIVRRALRAIERDDSEEAIDEVLATYLARLAAELSVGATVLCPGVLPLLDRIASVGRSALGLGTGNVRAGALLKLTSASLADRFAFGGFGCDAEDRSVLLRISALRGAQALGISLERCRIVVLGDTPKDIEAARSLGASCVAVATGPFSREQLAVYSPDLCCDDLCDPRIPSFLGV